MTFVRTSITDPLLIGEVSVNAAGARLGITFCPGKRGPSAAAHRWERDLEADLDVISDWGARILITLIEDHEFSMLGVPVLGERVVARGIEWIHLPITDLEAPDTRFEQGWKASRSRVLGQLEDGGRVLVHCRGGLGRAGTVAACMLIESGLSADEAVYRVRRARPGAIETTRQMQYVRGFRVHR
jgi:ADP-ribosyl-[dinitrogen reductase] hydrolase